jgi:putative ABC transport system ATP-binding protein
MNPPLPRHGPAAIHACALARWFPSPFGSHVVALPPRSFHAARGEAVALVGPSGCGKSTLLNLIGLLEAPSAGSLSMLGVDVLGIDHSARARFRLTRLGFIFQDFCLLKDRDVAANVELPLVYAGIAPPERRRRVSHWLARVGLEDLRERHPRELSGGQQQRVAIARAMVGAPAIVLADEPTGSLDATTGARVADDLLAFCDAAGATCVIATHDPALAARCHRIVRMDVAATPAPLMDHERPHARR